MSAFEGRIFVIGAGSMAEAFIRGVTERQAVVPERIRVINRSRPERLQALERTYGVRGSGSWADLAEADLVVAAVKPYDMAEALAQAKPYLKGQPVLSFAAGLTIDWLERQVDRLSPVARSMPNIPVAVLAGVTAVSFSDGMRDEDRSSILFLLSQVGDVVEIPEALMDAATAFSGSGPGFVCYFLEAMEAAAINLGFSPELARRLLLQTVVGTAKTLGEWGLSPRELRQRVTSPGGTTHAGVTVMETAELHRIVEQALRSAAARSEQLGKNYAAQ